VRATHGDLGVYSYDAAVTACPMPPCTTDSVADLDQGPSSGHSRPKRAVDAMSGLSARATELPTSLIGDIERKRGRQLLQPLSLIWRESHRQWR